MNYFANGARSYPKERIELHYMNRTIVLDNFRTLKGYGESRLKSMKTKIDKGHEFQFQELLERINKGGAPIDSVPGNYQWCKGQFSGFGRVLEKVVG